ncbi:MAG: acyl-CoA synthetase (AMP-forming)/AMP-acid ligase II [Bacteroidia bacterium]|jgi:acyl-CoA synthetase (AMP-forming)/AMP-acid ligase II
MRYGFNSCTYNYSILLLRIEQSAYSSAAFGLPYNQKGARGMSLITSSSIVEATTMPALIAGARAHWPNHDLVVFDSQRLSYADADARSALLARQLLASGVSKGSHVGLLLANSCEFVISWLAINRIGAVGVPLSTFSTATELRQLIVHADLHSLIFQASYLKHSYIDRLQDAFPSLKAGQDQFLAEAPFLRRCWIHASSAPPWASIALAPELPAAPPNVLTAAEQAVCPSDAAAIIYTSGSTGEPKGVVHSQGSLLRQSIKQAREKQLAADDRIFSSMPFFWVGGLSYKLLPAMQSGATVMGCASSTPADILDFIEAENITLFLGWPHAGQTLENDPSFPARTFKYLRGGYLFGAFPPEQRPPSLAAVCNALGMTETAGPHTAGHLSPLPEAVYGSFGWASEGMEYRIIDVDSGLDLADGEAGELWLRGDTLMMGLHKRERADVFTADGWFPSKDLVSRRDGHLFFLGRCDDVVKIKGANVSPKEVEDALNALPEIVQSIVTGLEHEGKLYLGAVVATVADLDLDSLPARLRTTLSAYKVPTVFTSLAVAELPYRSSGKLDRRALIERLQRALVEK